ncbi:PHP domain-containing protein [Frisingicoccus sp.]|uniref:PHP domain-containing protein n=1 Tax=Frisingicoccus sp. TaxID=1918627 RepID=UPI003AB35D15
MTQLTYDLHIHSCLSPCGDNDMTPANIAGMAAVKGLDVIAVTDHNSCRNCAPAMKMAEEYGVIALPGMELCTEEEVHVVCLFPDLQAALDFDAYVYDKMLKIPNKEKIFGEQLLYNDMDEIIGKEPNLLLCNTSIGFDEVYALTEERGGIMIPAHVDKTTNSLIANLGFIPPDSQFTCAEIKNLSKKEELLRQHVYLNQCRIISNSDAHYLEHINEPEHRIEVSGTSASEIIKALKIKA